MPARLEQLVVDAVLRDPCGLAVKDHESAWSYGELDAWSNRLASEFARLGVGRGDRVALWAPKSCRAVAVLQGVLRTGAAYVPIDPASPAVRANTIVEDCDVALIATTRAMGSALASHRRQFLVDDSRAWAALPAAGTCHVPGGEETDLAYVLYTSGSTGTPKGVCISHRNALAFVTWAVEAAGIRSREVFANHASFNFDLSVFDLYGAFLTGSTVCLVPEPIAYAAAKLVQFISTNRISVWYSVPSALVLMMEHGGLLDPGAPQPSVVIFAGEPFPIHQLRMLRAHWKGTRMFNFYGPTETNVCTSYEVVEVPPDQSAQIPIGSAASRNRVWAITDDGTVARVGERGELYVDGPTVMLGYWGRDPHTGPYATGDLCVLRSDGDYDFVGRRDDMIKCRGHRIEPGEIEAVLSQHADVRELAVAAAGEGVERRLVAFVVPRTERTPTLLELKAFGARHLPPYMLVDAVCRMDALPRTPNGKIDRRALHGAPLAPVTCPHR